MALTAQKYLQKAEPVVGTAPVAANVAHFTPQHTFMGKIEFLISNPERNRKMPAPGSLAPRGTMDLSALDHCISAHEALLKLMARSDGLDLNRVVFRNPVVPLFRMNFSDLYLVLTLHAERHMAQASRALAFK